MPCPSQVVTISLRYSYKCFDCVNVLSLYFM